MARSFLYLFGFYWFPVFGWAFLIFSLSNIPAEKLPSWEIPHVDKAIHFTEFGILAILLWRAFKNSLSQDSKLYAAGFSLILAFLYALFDEWHQRQVMGREPSLLDLFADTLGILFFLFACFRAKT